MRWALNDMIREEVALLTQKMEEQPVFHFCPEKLNLDKLTDEQCNVLMFNECSLTEFFQLAKNAVQHHIRTNKTGLFFEDMADGTMRLARLKKLPQKTEKAA